MGSQVGPISTDEIKQLAERGTIAHDTLIRKGESGGWSTAGKVKGLFPLPASISQPLTTAQGGEPPSASSSAERTGDSAPIDIQALAMKEMEEMIAGGVKRDADTKSVKRARASSVKPARAPKDQSSEPVEADGWGGLSVFLLWCGIAASLACFIAAYMLLSTESEAGRQGHTTVVEMIAWAVGVYCIGAGCFVGPVLIGIAAVLAEIRESVVGAIDK
jgi:hypothetical protein